MQRFAIAGCGSLKHWLSEREALRVGLKLPKRKEMAIFLSESFLLRDEVAYSVIMGDIETCQLQLVQCLYSSCKQILL
jgi:hypothetical protein